MSNLLTGMRSAFTELLTRIPGDNATKVAYLDALISSRADGADWTAARAAALDYLDVEWDYITYGPGTNSISKPANMVGNTCIVTVIGGGGGGASTSVNYGATLKCCAGNAGTFVEGVIERQTTWPVTCSVGTGGAAGATGSDGSDGNTSSFSGTRSISCPGGRGGKHSQIYNPNSNQGGSQGARCDLANGIAIPNGPGPIRYSGRGQGSFMDNWQSIAGGVGLVVNNSQRGFGGNTGFNSTAGEAGGDGIIILEYLRKIT